MDWRVPSEIFLLKVTEHPHGIVKVFPFHAPSVDHQSMPRSEAANGTPLK
jgi:hypothetical protein